MGSQVHSSEGRSGYEPVGWECNEFIWEEIQSEEGEVFVLGTVPVLDTAVRGVL